MKVFQQATEGFRLVKQLSLDFPNFRPICFYRRSIRLL
jgi:hypothetical protein